jgi:hypothetical protein
MISAQLLDDRDALSTLAGTLTDPWGVMMLLARMAAGIYTQLVRDNNGRDADVVAHWQSHLAEVNQRIDGSGR